MPTLEERITVLKKRHAQIQDDKRSLEVEIRFKEENLTKSKESLSNKGIDYDSLEDLREEIEAKKERLEDVVSNMEKVLEAKPEEKKEQVLKEETTLSTPLELDSDDFLNDFENFSI